MKTTSKLKHHRVVDRNSNYHRLVALKAAKEAERVLPIFEKECPNDNRPRQAIEAITAWAQGKRELGMAEVRKLSLGSHAAARESKSDAARFAARAAGHAVATWHVPTHAMAVPTYVCKAIAEAKNPKKKKARRQGMPSLPRGHHLSGACIPGQVLKNILPRPQGRGIRGVFRNPP